MNLPTQCPFCSHRNPRGARFCNECGSPLHLAPCERCDAVNDIDMRACYHCGATLHRAPADTAIPIEATRVERDSGGADLRPLADVPAALAKLLRESGERTAAAKGPRDSGAGIAAAAAPPRDAALTIRAASADIPATSAPVIAGSARGSGAQPAGFGTDAEKVALPFADEPSHSISSDIDVDVLEATPNRRPRRAAMPTVLAAIVLLVATTAVVGYVAFRQGLLPWPSTLAPIATPSAQPEAPASIVAPATDANSVPSTAESATIAAPTLTPPAPSSDAAATPTSATDGTTAAKSAASSSEALLTATPAVAPPPATLDAAPSSPEPANANSAANSAATGNDAAPAPRRASAPKADAGVDKAAAATQNIIQRETGGFGPPKPLPPRAPPAPR